MSRRRWSSWGALACALALTLPAAAAPVPGEQDKPLAQVPAKSAIVVQLKGFDALAKRSTSSSRPRCPTSPTSPRRR